MRHVVLSAVAALLFSASVQAQSTVDSIAAKYKLIPMPGALTIEKTFPVLGSYQLNTPVADATATSTSETAGTVNSSSTSGNTTVTADATTGTTTTTASDASASGMEPTAAGSLTITLDSANKGIIWVEGLPEGTVKAYLQKSPSTYRIVSQKTEDGKTTPEGTLILDTATKTLNIALGKAYDEVAPESVFAMQDSIAAAAATNDVDVKTTKTKSKSKSKVKAKPVTFYTATKVMPAEDATTAPADATQQQQTTEQTPTDSTQQNQNQNQQPATQPTPGQP